MKRADDFRLRLGKKEFVPIMTGGMGVDISTAELALVSSRLGGIGHISDAMVPTVSDRRFKTRFVKEKQKKYKYNVANRSKADVHFDLERLAEATKLHVGRTMEAKQGDGLIFINCMEKLTMNSPRETLRVRLASAMDGGIDGITLSAGLHLGSLALVQDHPRFRDVKFGIIVSSLRALLLFLRKNARLNRLPDYVIVEGPLAGGHLGFGMDWAQYDLKTIVLEIIQYLKQEQLDIPVIPAGGIFTGSDAVEFFEQGAAAVQRPNCEAYGYLLDGNGNCAYIEAYNRELEKHPDEENISVMDKTCLCTHMRNFDCWTCGHYTYRLKDTSRKLPSGDYQLLNAEDVFKDYLYSTEHRVALPAA